jgi:hypothetical protein
MRAGYNGAVVAKILEDIAPSSSAPEGRRLVRESTIAQMLSETQYVTMKDENHKREGQSSATAKAPGKESRQDRLKLALRENLKRRKSQARGRSDIATVPADGDDLSPREGNAKKPGE